MERVVEDKITLALVISSQRDRKNPKKICRNRVSWLYNQQNWKARNKKQNF